MEKTDNTLTSDKLFAILTTLTNNFNFYIAYSGGLDSHVLLHVMSECVKKNPCWNIQALHINHKLSPESDLWEQHCQCVCKSLKIPFQVERLKLAIFPGDSIEKIAREARYEVFCRVVQKDENILTAHTQNDQAETFLLQLMRGAGVTGLSAMPIKKRLGAGYLLRLLLNFHRSALKNYAVRNCLRWVEDGMNSELRFNRNYLRHKTLPSLQERWPAVFSVISRSANHCAEANFLLNQLADKDLLTIQIGMQLAVKLILRLTPPRQRNVLRRWISREGFSVPQTKQLEQIRKDVLKASRDANPVFIYDNVKIRRYRDMLYLSYFSKNHDTNLHSTNLSISWDMQSVLILPNRLGVLKAVKRKGKGIKIKDVFFTHQVMVCFRKGGERCRPIGKKEHHTLKKLMQGWKIPVWQRSSIPLIYYNEQLVSVVGYCICEEFTVKDLEWGWVIKLETYGKENR